MLLGTGELMEIALVYDFMALKVNTLTECIQIVLGEEILVEDAGL